MPLHLVEHANYPAVASTEAADTLLISDASDANATKSVPVSGLAGIPSAGVVVAPSGDFTATDLAARLTELQAELVQMATLTGGQYVGAYATFAALPANGTDVGNGVVASPGDIAILSADDGGNLAGYYTMGPAGAWGFTRALPDAPTVFVGATAGTAGTAGLVPAPAAGDQANFLTAAGTWAAPAGGDLQATTTLGNTTNLDMEITDATRGLILRSTGGVRWRFGVTDAGVLNTVAA